MELTSLVRFKVYQATIEALIQDEKIDFKYIFIQTLYFQNTPKKKFGTFYTVPTNYRLIFVDNNYKVLQLDPPLLFSDLLAANQEEAKKRPELQKKTYYQTRNSQAHPDKFCLVFSTFWVGYVIEMWKDDLKKFQSYLLKLPPLYKQPLIQQLKQDLLQTNSEISESFKDVFIKKKVKIIDEEQYWGRQEGYQQRSKEIIGQYQQAAGWNVDQVLNELMSYFTLYKLSPVDEPTYKMKLELINDISRNMDLMQGYQRNRPPKTNKPNKQDPSQEELFINIYEQQQINKELGKQYIKTFGLRMIDELIQLRVEEQGRILDATFLQQLELENDGVELKDATNQHAIRHFTPLITKSYQTNSEWERDRGAILQQLNSFNYDQKIERIEIQQAIKENHRLTFEVSAGRRQKIEERDKDYFTDVRKLYANIRRLLQFLYDGLRQQKKANELEEFTKLLQEEIKSIRVKILALQNDKDKFKQGILEDLQKQIEKAINETIYQ